MKKNGLKKVVLFVEDDPVALEQGEEYLKNTLPKGVSYIVRSYLDDARKVLHDSSIDVIGVITDNGYSEHKTGNRIGSGDLRGGAGLALAKEIRNGTFPARDKNIPIILTSIDMSSTKREEANNLGNMIAVQKNQSNAAHLWYAVNFINNTQQNSRGHPR